MPFTALVLALGSCTAPAIVPWHAGPHDTVFVELDRGDKGCLFIDDDSIAGPYVLSAAFAARPDSAFLGIAINHSVPRGLWAVPADTVLTPERARRFAFVHRVVKERSGAEYDLSGIVQDLTADNRLSDVHAETTGRFDISLTFHWNDEHPAWKVDLTMPYFVHIPGGPKGEPLSNAMSPMAVIGHGGSYQYLGCCTRVANGKECPE